MRKILERCPSCGGDLVISEVRCTRCETQVRSQYAPCPFCRLADDQITFLMLFVENRGNLSELEKQLGVSYPTVRNKLDEIVQIIRSERTVATAPLAEEPRPTPIPEASAVTPRSENGGASGTNQEVERRRILEQIASGAIDPVVGLERLKALEGNHG